MSFCASLHLYMSGIGIPSISQQVRIIHLGECSVANPNLKIIEKLNNIKLKFKLNLRKLIFL